MAKRKQRSKIDWDELAAAARSASENAYAPYSGLRVGAALLGKDGAVYGGCNVENSSFGLTLCAERAALVRAIADGEKELKALVIYTPDAGPLSPCGACRQALAEFTADLHIVSMGRAGLRREFDLGELLPQAFGWPAGEADSRAAGDEPPRRK